ncbi:MAG TPA: cytochrome c biogenesis protein DipZ [Vitreimonas sp.]|nr:cytochrome c biogenesis protein DipZ [Vitreimonas sp.]
MIILVTFAFLAGVVTILSPCILPVLPIILSGSVGDGHRRPLGIVAGFVLSFTFLTLALSSLVKATGVSPDWLRLLAVGVIAVFGVALLLPQVQVVMEKLFSRLSTLLPRQNTQDGFIAGMIVGVSLGILWAPCVGPILAAVITLALTSEVTFLAVIITLAYALGTGLPMLAITYGGRALLQRVPWLLRNTARIQKGFGVVMIAIAVALFMNWDRQFQTWVLSTFPGYGVGLTRFEATPQVEEQLRRLDGTQAPDQTGDQFGFRLPQSLSQPGKPAPDVTEGGSWLNSAPLSLAELKGKVVLIDFWTYSCINCIRTLPYLRGWHEKYADQGLVIIGVHTPEFEFEKKTTNVEMAIADFELKYPVVQDNEFKIWKAYENRFWPAKYLIDAQGNIRYFHSGEGAYDETEAAIQFLLKEAGSSSVSNSLTESAEPSFHRYQTPETYLGYVRHQFFANSFDLKKDGVKGYQAVPLDTHYWTLDGQWRITREYTEPVQAPATLRLQFTGKEVYLVMGADHPTEFLVKVNGQLQFLGEDVSPDGKGSVAEHRLYKLVKSPELLENATLELVLSPGIKAFAFTFGS